MDERQTLRAGAFDELCDGAIEALARADIVTSREGVLGQIRL